MSLAANAYARDEDVALRAPADFPLLCPRDQKVAAGADGRFLPDDRWTLVSGTVDFEARGLAAGQVVQLTRTSGPHRSPVELLAVAAVSGTRVTLRRLGQDAGRGEPPGVVAGSAGISFLVATLAPQLAAASDDLDRRFGLPTRVGLDAVLVRDATVLTVLARRSANVPTESLDSALAQLATSAGVDGSPYGFGPFGTRLGR